MEDEDDDVVIINDSDDEDQYLSMVGSSHMDCGSLGSISLCLNGSISLCLVGSILFCLLDPYSIKIHITGRLINTSFMSSEFNYMPLSFIFSYLSVEPLFILSRDP